MILTTVLTLTFVTMTAITASGQIASATASLFGSPSLEDTQSDSTSPYSANAAVTRNGGSFTSSSFLSRQSTETTGSASGTLTAFANAGLSGESGEARATVFDRWSFSLSQTAEFAFSGNYSTANPSRSNYLFSLTGSAGVVFQFSSGDGQSLSKSVTLQPGSYRFEVSANNFADASTPNDRTDWSYYATVPEPTSALLIVLGLAAPADVGFKMTCPAACGSVQKI